MTLGHLVLLALIQGITEFLPISSSGHLALVPLLTPLPDQGLALDVAVHVGTLLAVMLYVRREVFGLARGVTRLSRGMSDPEARMVLLLGGATVPVVVAGLLIHDVVDVMLRNLAVIGWTTLLFGILLGVADKLRPAQRTLESLRRKDALVIGFMQALALIPGTSRSGITMTAGRLLGFTREDAARFALLLSIPTIAGAGVLAGRDLMQSGDSVLTTDALLAGGLSCLVALAAIHGMMTWLKRASFMPFVVYRVGLGVVLLVLAYG